MSNYRLIGTMAALALAASGCKSSEVSESVLIEERAAAHTEIAGEVDRLFSSSEAYWLARNESEGNPSYCRSPSHIFLSEEELQLAQEDSNYVASQGYISFFFEGTGALGEHILNLRFQGPDSSFFVRDYNGDGINGSDRRMNGLLEADLASVNSELLGYVRNANEIFSERYPEYIQGDTCPLPRSYDALE